MQKCNYGHTSFWTWDWLRDLCAAVDAGEAGWGVPRYNGGLFSAGRCEGQDNDTQDVNPHKVAHRLLADSRVGALYLYREFDL